MPHSNLVFFTFPSYLTCPSFTLSDLSLFYSQDEKEIRYRRLTFDSIADGALRSTYLSWIESITHVKAGGEEKLELRLNSHYEKIWLTLNQRLEEPNVCLKSQYSTRLYQWAKRRIG